MTTLRVRLFGGLVLTWDDRPLPPISGAVARSLFAYLVTYRDRPHTRDLLAGTFWPDLPDATARRRLSQALWLIRKALEPHPILLTEGNTVQINPCEPPCRRFINPILLTEGNTVQINPDLPLWLDVAEFEQQVTSSRQQESSPAARCLLLAADLYRGEFLAGYYDDWILAERERLREMFLATLERLVAGLKARGEYEGALVHARRLAGEDPWREEAHRQVMRLCHLLGRDVEALKQFETCRQVLQEELGVEPEPETVALATEIAQQMPPETAPYLPPVVTAPFRPLERESGPAGLPLVGREEERTALLSHLEAALHRLGGLVLVEGEAGVGKTRLLQELARDAEWRDMRVLWGHGRETTGLAPFAPWLEALQSDLSPLRLEQWSQLVAPIWLQVLCPLLPGLAAVAPDPAPPLEPEQERERLVNAFAQLLAAWSRTTPLLLILEDLHWADEDSLELLDVLCGRLRGHKVLVVGSYRGGEARAHPAVWERLQALRHADLRGRLILQRLDAGASGELIRRSLGMKLAAPLFEARLYRETGGNPLFLLEILRSLYDEGLLFQDAHGRWRTPWDETTAAYAELPLPAAVEQVIARRLANLSPAERAVLETAAVLGGGFDFHLLQAAGGQEAGALLPAVHILLRRHFLVEQPAAYEFGHDQIRQVVYHSLAPQQQQTLHRQVAQALEALHPEQTAALAHHFAQGEVWDRAADYHRQAGDQARAVYAHAEAVRHYRQALAALERLAGAPQPARAFDLHLALETVYGLLGDRAAQREELAALETLAEQSGDARQRAEVTLRRARHAEVTSDYPAAVAAAQRTVSLGQAGQAGELEAAGSLLWGRALWRAGEYEAAQSQLMHALALSRQEGLLDVEADSRRNLGTLAFYRGDYIQARTCYEEALPLYRQAGNRLGESVALNNLGAVLHCQDEHDAARICFEQVLQLKHELGDRRGEGVALNNLGSGALAQGDYSRAGTWFEQALSIFGEIGDRQGEGVALGNLGVVADRLGDYAQAERYFRQALALFRPIGNRLGEGETLANLALLAHHQGDDQAARQYSQQSLSIARELDDQAMRGYALTNLGHALAGLGRLAEAAEACRQAVAVRREMDEHNLAAESLAGLVRVLLDQGEMAQAQAGVEEMLSHLAAHHALDGAEEPMQVYLTCYQALHAGGDPRARSLLDTAHRLLQEQAGRIADQDLRRSFLEKVDAHRQIVAAWEASQPRRIVVRLPRADAPLGRPLRDDEYVAVAWTVDAPEDTAMADKASRRQARLSQLLREAVEQGAAPTVDDLAAALGVSRATVKRDLAALRRAGQAVETRGSC